MSECQECGNDVIWAIDETGQRPDSWAEFTWGDDRDFQCGLSEDRMHHV